MKKRLLLLTLISAAAFALSGCSNETYYNFDFNKKTMTNETVSIASNYIDVSDVEYDYIMSDGEKFEQSAVNGFRMAETTDKVGEFEGFPLVPGGYGEVDVDVIQKDAEFVNGNDGDILCTVRMDYSDRDVDFTVYYKENKEFTLYKKMLLDQLVKEANNNGETDIQKYIQENYYDSGISTDSVDAFVTEIVQGQYQIMPYTPVDAEVSAVYTKGELLKKAGINTAIGMITVFVVLIFIAFIISLLKYVPKILSTPVGRSKREEEKKEEKLPIPEPIPTIIPADIDKDDLEEDELIAVITAAVNAYMSDNGAALPAFTDSNDKLIVRSIRRIRR